MRELGAVLRLGHRPDRDKRMTTHVGLTARAFGLRKMYMPDVNTDLRETLEDVSERFGGDFAVKERKNWERLIKNWSGDTVHLTMYGSDIDGFFGENEIEDPLVIVGSEKVPKQVYDIADHNVAVGSQPHSEVASLAVFLDRYNGRDIPSFTGGEISVLPSDEGKRVIDHSKIPSASECFEFAKDLGMDDGLMSHTLDVMERALQLREKKGGDLRLVVSGALLHDIGRTVTHDLEHGVEGAKIVREQGWSDELAKIVERHIGGGITKDEAEEQGLPARSFLPETLEEKIICHADNTAGEEERFERQIRRTEEAGHQDSAERMRDLAEEFGEL